jgi:hypothetical protein
LFENRKLNQTYLLDCYDDLEYYSDLISSKQYEKLSKAPDSIINLVDFLKDEYITNSVYNTENNKRTDFNVRMVHGTFLGKKIRKRINSFLKILIQIHVFRYMI